MRLAEPATVFKFERLKPPYVGVTADSVKSPFFPFFFNQQEFPLNSLHFASLRFTGVVERHEAGRVLALVEYARPPVAC